MLYSGKSSALGIKQVNSRTSKWSELGLTKTPKITQIAVGHEGMHAVLLTEEGSVFFTGIIFYFSIISSVLIVNKILNFQVPLVEVKMEIRIK